MPTYVLSNTNSDLSGGADFSKKLLDATESANSIVVSVAASSTETSYAWTEPSIPNNGDWETGGITVEVKKTSGGDFMYLKVSASRVNSSGTVQETTTETAEQSLSLGGPVYTFSIASYNWAAGSASDRIRINYIFRNSSSKGANSITIETGTTDTEVVTVITEVSGTEATLRIAQKAVGDKIVNARAGHFIDAVVQRVGLGVAQQISFDDYDPPWWDTNYFRRREIQFGTNHGEYPVDYTKGFNLITGYAQRIATNGHPNESIEHPSRQMAYYNNCTYVVWHAVISYGNPVLPQADQIRIFLRKFDHTTQTWSDPVNVAQGGELHWYPAILITEHDNAGIIHVFYGCHDSELKYKRSTNAEDITAWNAEQTIGADTDYFTYPKAIERSNGDIYVFARGYSGFRHSYAFNKSTDGGVTWQSRQRVAHFTTGEYSLQAIYNGGLICDENDRVHLVLNYHDGYGDENKGHWTTYMYSDDMVTWRKIDGTAIGTTQSDPVTESDIEKVFESGNPWPGTGPFYHTNNETLTLDSNNYPYFLVGAWFNTEQDEVDLYLCQWTGSAWLKTNLSALPGVPKTWSRRYLGVMYIDGTEIHIVTTVPAASDTEEYYAGELFKFRGVGLTSTQWTTFYVTKNSGYGLPQLNTLPKKYPGRYREYVYCRDVDVYWWEDREYLYVRPDGEDVRVIRHKFTPPSTYDTPIQLERLPLDTLQFDNSEIGFRTDVTVPANSPHPHNYDRYFVYYANPNAVNAPHEPEAVFIFYDGFEEYLTGTSIAGQGGWTGASAFKILRHDDFTTYEFVSEQVIFDGRQCLYVNGSSDVNHYVAQTITLNAHEITVRTNGTQPYLELYDSSSAKWFRIIIRYTGNRVAYRRDTDGDYVLIDSSVVIAGAPPPHHEIKMTITPSGINAWVNDVQVITNDTHMTSATALRIGQHALTGSNNHAWYDRLIVRKFIDTEEATTTGSEEGSDALGSIRFGHKVAPIFFREKRLMGKVDTIHAKTLRMAQKAHLEKLTRLRAAHDAVLEQPAEIRIGQRIVGETIDSNKLAELLTLETRQILRAAHKAVPEKTEEERATHQSVLEASKYEKLAGQIVGELTKGQKFTHLLDNAYSAKKSAAHKAALERAVFAEIAQLLVPEDTDTDRQVNALMLQKTEAVKLANMLSMWDEKVANIRFHINFAAMAELRFANRAVLEAVGAIKLAQSLGLESAQETRIGHDIEPERYAAVRIIHAVVGEIIASARAAHRTALEKETDSRSVHRVAPANTGKVRLAHLVSAFKFNQARISQIIIFIAAIRELRLLNARGRGITIDNPVSRSVTIENAGGRGITLDNPRGRGVTLENARGRRVSLDEPN